MSLVSVILVTYNSEKFIADCIHHIQQSEQIATEIIVVDNNSQDHTRRILEKFNVKKVYLNFNAGFSKANNIGSQYARSDYLFFLNHDAFVDKDCIFKLYEFYKQKNSSNLILAPMLLNVDGSFQLSFWEYPTVLDVFKEAFFLNYFFNKKKYSHSKKYLEVSAISGAALFMGKKLFENLKGFDENLFWVEDVDLCYRNNLSGGSNVVLFEACCKHFIGGSGKNFPEIVIPNQILSRLKFFYKHKKMEYPIVFILLLIQCVKRSIVLSLWPFLNKSLRKKRNAYIKALKYLFIFIFKKDVSIH